jgi:translation initiation factor 1 (eIF-1/SUI1)
MQPSSENQRLLIVSKKRGNSGESGAFCQQNAELSVINYINNKERTMKKLAALLAVMLLATGLTACGKSEAEIQKEKQAEVRKQFYSTPFQAGKGY